MEVTSAAESSGPGPQHHNGHLPRSLPCPGEDGAPSLRAPQPPRAPGTHLQGPSVLESKVRALKEKMTAGKQGASPCFTAHEQPSPKKPKGRRVKVGGARTPSEGPLLPDAVMVLHAQNLADGQLNSSVDEEEPTRNGGPVPPSLSAPALECWGGRSPRPPEAVWTLPDHERGLLPGPGSLQESPPHGVTPGQLRGRGPCHRITHPPNLRKARPCPLLDGVGTGGDLDGLSLTSEEECVLRPAPLGGLWRAGDPGAPDTGGSALSLSDRVERNRLLLQEILMVGGQAPPKVGIPAWTPSWDRMVPERPAVDVDGDSGISLQDLDQNRTSGPKPEPGQRSPRHEEAKHLLQRARMKARTRPLRASHDIVPTIAQGSRDGGRGPGLDPRRPLAGRDPLQNGSTSDSSSGESSSGQWPKRGASPSRVRFEDESAREAESRYLERLQQRQRQVLSPTLQTAAQGPLCSKPELADYVAGGPPRGDAGEGGLHRLVGRLHQRALPAPPPTWGSEMCRACGSCMEDRRPVQGTAAPNPGALQEHRAASAPEALLGEPLNVRGLSAPVSLLPVKQGLRTEWIRETHAGPSMRPEDVDSALDSTDTSDSCRTDSEEAGTAQPSRARGPARGSSPRLRGCRPRGGHRWFQKAEMEPPGSPLAPTHLPGVDLKVSDEAKAGRGHTPEETLFPREEVFSTPPVQGSEGASLASLGSQGQPGPALGNHCSHPEDSWALCRAACAVASSMKLASSRSGQQVQDPENRASLQTVPLRQSRAELCAPHQAQQPTAPLSPRGGGPTPPYSRKTASSGPHRRAALAGPRRPGDQGEPLDTPLLPTRSVVPRTCDLTPPQTESCSAQVSGTPLTLSTNNCDSSAPGGPQEPWGGAIHEGRVRKGTRSQEPEAPLENCRADDSHTPLCAPLGPPRAAAGTREAGSLQDSLGSTGVGTIRSMAVTLSLASEKPKSSQDPEGGLQRTESSSEGHVSSRARAGVSAGPSPPSAAPSDRNKKSSGGSIASALGLKFLLALGQSPRHKLGKSRSYSVEQLPPPAPGSASHTSTPKVKRAPSLQFLQLGRVNSLRNHHLTFVFPVFGTMVSPCRQHRKAASFQNLHSLLSGKVDRSSLYLVGEPGDHSSAGRLSKAPPRRALSVDDVGAPSLARTVGRVVEVFPDGTSQLQLQRSPEGTFGFRVSSGNGRRDSGFYVQEMADGNTAKLYSGLLGVGDEILEVNGAKVAGLGLAHVKELLAHAESLSLRVLRQRPVPR